VQRERAVAGLELLGLVNNAGYLNAGLLVDVPIEDARAQLEVMVLGPLDLSRRVLPHMVHCGEGRIINVTSAASHASIPFSGWYAASKSALRQLTDALRLELADSGVKVIDIEPGGFSTGIWTRARIELEARRHGENIPAYDKAEAVVARFASSLGDPRKVAEAIVRAMKSPNPPPHMRIGKDAAILRVISDVLPDRVLDKVTTTITKMK
jgi:short-subunit dehydrogenase